MPRGFKRAILTVIALGVLTIHPVKAQESSWIRVFDDLYISSIETAPFGLLTGEFDTRVWLKPYNGIYVSKNLGESWKPLGLKDKGITHIKYSDYIYATTYYHTNTPPGLYVSKDMGTSWEHIGPDYSANYVYIIDGTIFLGTEAYGLLVSFDKGITWEEKVANIRIEQIKRVGEKIIVSASNKTYESYDKGKTWTKVTLNRIPIEEKYKDYLYTIRSDDIYENNIKTNLELNSQDLAITHTKPPYLFATANGYGIYKYEIPQRPVEKYPFLSMPWEKTTETDLVDRITAYFDHEYPLLGYSQYMEPNETKETTVNFWGMRERKPILYYSSHNGTDYSLSYGDNIVAAASGIAKYYWCDSCGNTIEIDHQNGYKTVYMHLQTLQETKALNNINIEKGQFIGKVGMTGNTTGPHLHFLVKKDNVVIDPYGWNNEDYTDPWEIYSWIDNSGSHQGSRSPYLWDSELKEHSGIVNEVETSIQLENKKVNFTSLKDKVNYTVLLRNYINPGNISNLITYVKGTSLLIQAIDLLGKTIKELPEEVEIIFNIDNMDLSKVLTHTINVYHFNEIIQTWEPLETIIDLENNTVKAQTSSFSHFALFAQPKYSDRHFLDILRVKNTSMILGSW